MIAGLDLSMRLAGLPQDQADRVKDVIMACGLPTSIPSHIPTDSILAALGRDKKFDAGAIRFVLTPKLGSAFVSDKVTLDDVTDIIKRLQV
jgi:3-dehydroquinate synthase